MNEKVIVNKEGNTITRINIGDREITLIGTAHVSPESVEEVKKVIVEERPDHVCVEIDAIRYKSMTQEQSWKEMDIVKVIKEKRSFLLIANLMLSSFQKRMGSSVGMKPGEDMKIAVQTAEENNINFSFIDREVQTTLKRAWAKSSFWNKNKVLAVLLSSAFSSDEASAEDIEELKDRNELEGMMDELAKELPKVKEVLIDERDQFLATSTYNRPEKKVLAVVGAGHVPGMIEWFKGLESGERANDISKISIIPPKSLLSKSLPFVIPVIIIALITLGFIFNGKDVGFDMIKNWVLTNGILSGFGALLALGHPLTIIAAFVAAPITSLNPLIGVGIVTGIVETALRKPRVEDFETLSESISHIKLWYKNRVLRILLVVLLSSFGSVAGTWIGGAFLATVFG
ncbi:MAG: TraB/GumN family protein [Spirochaetales bacterium]|nr:TraB/GumN family protein [Spirochaetales bacterium]